MSGSCDPSSTASTTIRTGMNGFGVFGTGLSTPINLPIELITFSGENDGETNLLHWVTATEINNSYFTIEHSADGVIFTTCERIQGAGNSNYAISYEAIDHHPFKKTYYRLKQTDFDGKFTYSQIIVIALKNNSTRLIS
ncbi:MAG: hypothetical protein IPN88_04550 [Bacteroidetes bacterium]|nr:hypothetical protein [Bacteroidota bacterium]